MRLLLPAQAPTWLAPVLRSIENAFREPMSAPFRFAEYPVAELPDAAKWRNGGIVVPDEIGGRTLALSDGTNWRRTSDNAIVS